MVAVFLNPAPILPLFSQEKGLKRTSASLLHNIKAIANAMKPHQRRLVTKTELCEAVSIVINSRGEHRH